MSTAWIARPGTADDLADLRTLVGPEAAPPAAGATLWVAESRGRVGAALVRRRHEPPAPPPAWFRLGWAVHASAELGLYRRQRTLLLGHDLVDADELAGWALADELPAAAAGDAWHALLQAALADAAGPVIAALPGLRDGYGRSPVWQGLGRHFHAQELDAARRHHGPDWERHVAPLLPRHLLYASLLPEATQAALGQCLPAALPLQRALQAAGFAWRGHVGIVDGGPVLERDAPA